MTPERWQKVKTVFFDAMEREETQERAAYLDVACANDVDLRQRVQSLLDQPSDEFDSLAREIRLNRAERDIGRRIGAYELVRELGRGGMGAVWLGRRADQQFDKVVAIKLLKRGTDTDEVLRRFQTERQILARLEHPNIARLLDGGVTDDNLPYFVMEYVEGQPVTDYSREKALSLEDRLRLFLKICGAVQFAHQNLIVHRDLKPGNILVTHDGEPKLLDFGIAKLLSPDDATLAVTMAEHQRLTPAYASPEQVRGEPITTASDVYSLGTILYELLAGKNAHRFSVPHPPPTELLRVVTQDEPIRPSAAAADSSIARQLRGDLDNIILKALRKEPPRRYPGVGSLAADLQRHLANEPVSARKDTVGYRASKFVLRNKIGAAAAAIVLLTLIGAVIGISYQARRATRRFNEVRSLAHSVLFDYHDAIANLPGSTAVRQKLVQDSLDYLDRLGREAGNDRGLQREIADAYFKVGDVEGRRNASNLGNPARAVESYLKALNLWERLSAADPADLQLRSSIATVYSRLGEVQQDRGDLATAVAHHRKAIAIAESVVANPKAGADDREALAQAHTTLGDVLGNPNLANLGDASGALESYGRGLQIREQLALEEPNNPERRRGVAVSNQRVANMLQVGNDIKGAADHYRHAAEIGESLIREHPDNVPYRRELALSYQFLALTSLSLGELVEAKDFQLKTIALRERNHAADPQNATALSDVFTGYMMMIPVLGRQGDVAGAKDYGQKALDVVDKMLAQNPNSFNNLGSLRGLHQRLADLFLGIGDGNSALEHAREEMRINEQMRATQPTNVNVRRSQGLTHLHLGKAYKLLATTTPADSVETKERWRQARAEFQLSADIYQELKTKNALLGADSAKLDELAKEIASCDSALASGS